MKLQIVTFILFLSSALMSCQEEPSNDDTTQEKVKDFRKEALELQEKVQQMQPQIEKEAQRTTESVEKKAESSPSP